MQWVRYLLDLVLFHHVFDESLVVGKVGMSVLTKGLAMDFARQDRKDMAITSIWPAVVSTSS
jgi:hypothetical protein